MKKLLILLLVLFGAFGIAIAQSTNSNQGSQGSNGNSSNSDCESCSQTQTNNSQSTQNQGEDSNLSNTQQIRIELNKDELKDLEYKIQAEEKKFQQTAEQLQNQFKSQIQNQLKLKTAISAMHQVANTLKAQGSQLSPYTQSLENYFNEAIDTEEKLNLRSRFAEFFIGADQDTVEQLQTLSEEISVQIDSIDQELKTFDTETQTLLSQYVDDLYAEQTKLDDYVSEKSNTKGIFYWMFGWLWGYK